MPQFPDKAGGRHERRVWLNRLFTVELITTAAHRDDEHVH
jgi:hypothetical protein